MALNILTRWWAVVTLLFGLVVLSANSTWLWRSQLSNDLMDRIDAIIESRSLLKHPFYQEWTKGTLPLDSLRRYAAQYYHFEQAYPRFLSGVHHRCHDVGVRQLLLDNLWDEEHGDDNHVELWLRFCDALGLDREDVRSEDPSEATMALVRTFEELTTESPTAAGAAALYAFESQVPGVAREKILGLDAFYDIGGDDVAFFTVHESLDVQHAEAERAMISTLVSDETEEESAVRATDRAATSLWAFLDGVY